MSPDFMAGFVNRKAELHQFRQILAGETEKRILLIVEEAGKGKTYLLHRFFYECKSTGFPVVMLDLDLRQQGVFDFLRFVREIRRQLGDENTPMICAAEDSLVHRPVIKSESGKGGVGIDFGSAGLFEEADILDVAGRDSISISSGEISGPGPMPEPSRLSSVMGRAMLADLSNFDQVILLLDHFEQAPTDLVNWLERWLFTSLHRELRHARMVLAGRPECRSFFRRLGLWGDLVSSVDHFAPLSEDDIQAYLQQRSLTVSEAELRVLLELVRHSPDRLALFGDLLAQAREGAQ